MFAPERCPKIESYGQAYERLAAAVRGVPRSMWAYRPDAQDWTIHEILVHLADSEAVSYVRCCRPVSYTHLDVYKRQARRMPRRCRAWRR